MEHIALGPVFSPKPMNPASVVFRDYEDPILVIAEERPKGGVIIPRKEWKRGQRTPVWRKP